MTKDQQYDDDTIIFVLWRQYIVKEKPAALLENFSLVFKEELTEPKRRYLINKYKDDPKFRMAACSLPEIFCGGEYKGRIDRWTATLTEERAACGMEPAQTCPLPPKPKRIRNRKKQPVAKNTPDVVEDSEDSAGEESSMASHHARPSMLAGFSPINMQAGTDLPQSSAAAAAFGRRGTVRLVPHRHAPGGMQVSTAPASSVSAAAAALSALPPGLDTRQAHDAPFHSPAQQPMRPSPSVQLDMVPGGGFQHVPYGPPVHAGSDGAAVLTRNSPGFDTYATAVIDFFRLQPALWNRLVERVAVEHFGKQSTWYPIQQYQPQPHFGGQQQQQAHQHLPEQTPFLPQQPMPLRPMATPHWAAVGPEALQPYALHHIGQLLGVRSPSPNPGPSRFPHHQHGNSPGNVNNHGSMSLDSQATTLFERDAHHGLGSLSTGVDASSVEDMIRNLPPAEIEKLANMDPLAVLGGTGTSSGILPPSTAAAAVECSLPHLPELEGEPRVPAMAERQDQSQCQGQRPQATLTLPGGGAPPAYQTHSRRASEVMDVDPPSPAETDSSWEEAAHRAKVGQLAQAAARGC